MTTDNATILRKLAPGKTDREIESWFRRWWLNIGAVSSEHFSAWSPRTWTRIDVEPSGVRSILLRAYRNAEIIFEANFTCAGDTVFEWRLAENASFFANWELLFIGDAWRRLKPIELSLVARMRTTNEGLGSLMPLAELARSRKRDIAAHAIHTRLCEILDCWKIAANRQEVALNGRLIIQFWTFRALPRTQYFRVTNTDDGRILMTGHVGNISYGNYADGQVYVMTWRRGWELELFEEQDWLIT